MYVLKFIIPNKDLNCSCFVGWTSRSLKKYLITSRYRNYSNNKKWYIHGGPKVDMKLHHMHNCYCALFIIYRVKWYCTVCKKNFFFKFLQLVSCFSISDILLYFKLIILSNCEPNFEPPCIYKNIHSTISYPKKVKTLFKSGYCLSVYWCILWV